MKEKVILAYSGGLDTTTIIPWLKENFGYEVICCCIAFWRSFHPAGRMGLTGEGRNPTWPYPCEGGRMYVPWISSVILKMVRRCRER